MPFSQSRTESPNDTGPASPANAPARKASVSPADAQNPMRKARSMVPSYTDRPGLGPGNRRNRSSSPRADQTQFAELRNLGLHHRPGGPADRLRVRRTDPQVRGDQQVEPAVQLVEAPQPDDGFGRALDNGLGQRRLGGRSPGSPSG